MLNKYIVLIPSELKIINTGVKSYKKTERLICNASSFNEVYIKYPKAIAIQEID